MASPSLNFRLPQELLDSTASYALSIERTPGWVARKALETYLTSINTVPARKPTAPRTPKPSHD